VIDAQLETRLNSIGGVVLEGAKACGKTESARQVAASELLLDLDEAAQATAQVDPALVLEGPTPRLIDEWQIVPKLWNQVRRTIDDRGLPFRLTTRPATSGPVASRGSAYGR
jgi:hypothetical protein